MFHTFCHGCSKVIRPKSLVINLRRLSPHVQKRSQSSFPVSRNGFVNYEQERSSFRLHVPEDYNFMKHHFDGWTHKTPNNLAFWWRDDNGNELKWTFSQLNDLARRASNTLTAGCGLKSGDTLMVVLPRLPEWWIIKLACIRSGIIVCPGTSMLTKNDLLSRVKRCQADGIVVMPDRIDDINEIEEEYGQPLRKICVSGNLNEIPSAPDDWFNFKKMLSHGSNSHECVRNKADDAMLIYFTSGTTGASKMVLHTYASYGVAHMITGRYWYDVGPGDLLWSNGDTGWAKSAWNFFGPWIQGCGIYVHHTPAFDPESTLRQLQEVPITTFCSAPTAYRFLVQQDLDRYKPKALQHSLSAGEPMTPETNEKWHAATGTKIYEGYGQTETGLIAATFRCIEHKPGSLGKASPGFNVKIVNDSGEILPPHEEGHLAVLVNPERPVGLFHGYKGEFERTKRSFAGDFYLTGDRALMDEDGYIWFISRADDVIISAGYRIGPFEVESALQEHPYVVESAVAASPDSQRGQIVKAFVVLKDIARGLNEDVLKKELQDHVKTTTAPYKYPREIEFVSVLPKTISGKTRRVELREREYSHRNSS